MASEAPPFWWQKPDWRAVLLWPASLVWGQVSARRMRGMKKVAFELPVISVATLAIGATGRTLVAMELARAAKRIGRRPGLLSAGPQGTSATPHAVDPHHDLARHVGDEAMELALAAPTVICSDIAAGARKLAAEGHDLLILADGRMADRLSPDRLVVVADARRGLGNGFVVPAGPVRAPITDQLRQAHVLVRLGGGDAADRLVRLASRAGRPVIDARISPPAMFELSGQRVLAFAGIGDNAQFFETLRVAGADLVVTRSFGDGHRYAEDEVLDLLSIAEGQGLAIATTARDRTRLAHGGEAARAIAARAAVFAPSITFDPAEALEALVRDAVNAWRMRRGA